ncbi:MAG TPA: hypothetical protein DCZ94_19335 [Lentisphaeria bacterium]|nr:MAG: hypothetical protein A2X48_01580 [Lentisphaerae bacterium GWF2_49_21]HBC89098.1 hypothetical protein [Lentisphaeria bacterium]
MKTKKNILWLLIADSKREDLHCAIPTLAWIAKSAGAEFECYLESERDGSLFARNGSTVIGGHHHQQFNYLNAAFEVKYILLGDTSVFRSSIDAFGAEIIVESESLLEAYEKVLRLAGIKVIDEAIFTGSDKSRNDKLEIGPYLFPEIWFRRAVAFPADLVVAANRKFKIKKASSLFVSLPDHKSLKRPFKDLYMIDSVQKNDSYGSISLRIAERWKHKAKALAFADPAAVRAQIATLCREDRIAVYENKNKILPKDVVYSAYTEEKTKIADDVIRLAEEIGNRVLVGRQTGDGDLFAWSKAGLCLQIMDPNRPAFPIVTSMKHHWHKEDKGIWDDEPDDETLLKYAKEGKILSTLIWHSGEMAHNEAMLALLDLISFTGVKMGFGVHAARYETCPQMWELLSVPKSKGGVLGHAEPVLHSGGMGVLAEVNCPPNELKEHCRNSISRIRNMAGDYSPKGYYAFMDSDLPTLSFVNKPAFKAVQDTGMEYFISSATPGRNRIVHREKRFTVINQSCRVVHPASPFVRITTADDLETYPHARPGWMIGTLDAPVIAFAPYIWKHGTRFMQLIDKIKNNYVNVLPRTIARYARILEENGFVRKELSRDGL